MEDLAASIMSVSHSAPLYLFFDVPAWEEYWIHGGSFDFAAAAGAKSDKDNSSAAPRACASDVSTNAYANELFRGGALRPLKLPPRLQHPADWSAATSSTGQQQLGRVPSWSPFTSGRKQHSGFDPFVAALDKVRRDGAPTRRRARSLSPLRGAAVPAKSLNSSRLAGTVPAAAQAQQKASGRPPWRSTGARRRGVKQLVCWAVMTSSDAGQRDLRSRRQRDVGAPHRPGLLICFGF